MDSSSSTYNYPCAACKFLRRKCLSSCNFAPYFPAEDPQKFANVHKIFGASNVTKLLTEVLPHQREDAINSLAYEADARIKDPVYGCVGTICFLQRQVECLQKKLDEVTADLIRYASNHEINPVSLQNPNGINQVNPISSLRQRQIGMTRRAGNDGGFSFQPDSFPCPYVSEEKNRPDLLARVFRAKLEMLKKHLLKDRVFGVPIACVYSIEFQKRGLPHAHLLLIMDRDSKPLNPEAYDRFISAELPNPSLHPRLHELVLKHIVHGPCDLLNPKCPCMWDKKCKNRFPKDFLHYTTHGCNSYPHYRRRDTGISARVRGHVTDNRWIVPYNPYLLQKYDFHINVEICSTIKLVKYIYKYIYKGPDKIAYQLALPTSEDEIKQYQDGRWVGPPEVAWRMYGFDLFDMQPTVVALQLHLPDNYLVSFTPDQDLNNVASNNFLSRTMLMQFLT